MKRIFATLAVTAVAYAVMASTPAFAGGVIPWTGHGSENLPCANGGWWVLAPAFGITSATLTVNEVDYVMHQNGEGSWAVGSSGTVTVDSDAYVSYTGAGDDRDHLQLSHCVTESESPTPSPTESESPTPSPTESESVSPTPSETGSPTPSESESETPSTTTTPSVVPTTHTPTPHSPTVEAVTPSPTAMTGPGHDVLFAAGAVVGLTLAGAAAMRYGTRTRKD